MLLLAKWSIMPLLALNQSHTWKFSLSWKGFSCLATVDLHLYLPFPLSILMLTTALLPVCQVVGWQVRSISRHQFNIVDIILHLYRKPPHHQSSCRQLHLWSSRSYGRSVADLQEPVSWWTGIPCPGLFTQAQVHFNMDMDLIDKEYYQSRIFCCAATGSYDLESSDTMISVRTFSHQLVSLQFTQYS